MAIKNTKPRRGAPPPEQESDERKAAMIEWLKEINGRALPQRSSPTAPGIDALDVLVTQLSSASLDDIKANMPDEMWSKLGVADMTEAALKSLIVSAANMSISVANNSRAAEDEYKSMPDDEPSWSSPAVTGGGATYAHISGDWRGWEEDGGETGRCWTSGTVTCTCRVSMRDYGPRGELYEDPVDVACDLDCPAGRSVAEMRGPWTQEYSPCCGELNCDCTNAADRSPWLCDACGQVNCVCSE